MLKWKNHDYLSTIHDGSSPSYDDPSQSVYCSPSSSKSHYYGFPSKELLSKEPSYFYGSKVDEDSQEVIDEVYKILFDIGVYSSEKAKFRTYLLKDVAQNFYVQWRDNRLLRGGPVTWYIFKATFLYWFFHRDMREEKVMKFINICQGGNSVHEYSLEFIKLSKYSPSLVLVPSEQMSRFVIRVSEDLQEECQSSMLHDNMNISRLIVYERRVKEARSKRKSRVAKRERLFIEGSSKNRL